MWPYWFVNKQGETWKAPAIEPADIWATCEHDDGHGACFDCQDAGMYQWMYLDGDGDFCTAETLQEASERKCYL